MGTNTDFKDLVKVQTRTNIKPPKQYRVIYINDEITTVEFVIESLMVIFQHDRDSATSLTDKIHTDGSAIVAVLPYEMAEQRGIEATMLARNNGFPLQIKLEPDA
jgi:ATP-dependent Clp protease adaptor protein ClpS